jgi:membrane protein
MGPWLLDALAVACAWLMFLIMYKFLPQHRVRWRAAAMGAAAAAVIWEVSRIAFAAMMSHSAGYGSLYGSLAGTVVVGVWVYLTATVMLLGAELAVVLQDADQTREG